jgi:tetratricopeptide (TPR) repeat protein
MPSPKAVAGFGEAVAAFEAGRPADAERICRAVLKRQRDHFDAANLLAIIQFLRGAHAEALASFDRALAIRPADPDTLCNRGKALKDLGRFEAALASYDAALAVRPDDTEALYHRGIVLKELGRFEAALASFDRVLAVRPGDADALNVRGNLLKALARCEEALASYDRALALRPHFTEALNNRGVALQELKRFEEALASYERALALGPDQPDALNNRGVLLTELRRFDEALASFDRALGLSAGHAGALYNRGNALKEGGRLDEALASYDRALAVQPDHIAALNNRGAALEGLDRIDAALASYDRTLAVRPDHVEAHNNRGNVLHQMGQFGAASASFARAQALRPDFADPYNNRGLTLHEQQRYDEALASYDRAIALKPDYAEAHFNAATCLLLQGAFGRGWREYEWRWQTESMKAGRRGFAEPLWLGAEDLRGRTILLHGEQGFGDTLQFCRYAAHVARMGARVLIEVPPELVTLMRSLDGPAAVIAAGEPLPPFDCHCPLASLPLAFGTTLDTVPAAPRYLAAPSERIALWRERLGDTAGHRVGLVWAGNPRLGLRNANRVDRQRSLDFDQLAPVLAAEGCTFYSLQKGAAAVAQLHACGHRVIDHTEALRDFADTAALVANLDLVIAVDTSVAHLAAAVGKPVWLLNRFNTCWRWLLAREDSPWYPTLRIFRQPSHGDWTAVIAQVAAELQHAA